MFKFKISSIALTVAALTSSVAWADPSSYTHISGTKVIDIEKPNAAGVSHNMYREFNVDSKGVVLNNSSADVSHTTLGNIPKNNNLTDGAASVILNEVLSNKASTLNGFLEVNGQKADVIIANPNGITCSGCSFINTNRTVLTTGNVALDDTGALKDITVTGGKLTVNNGGMNVQDSYAILLAEAVTLNGTVNATNALIAAGSFTYDTTKDTIAPAGKKPGNLSQNSIDISNLGGVKADSITMVGNNLGFGVRNQGTIAATSKLVILSNGALVNEGNITSNGISTQLLGASIKNTGSIKTNNTTTLNSASSFSNTGTIQSDTQLSVTSAGNFENKGTVKGTGTLSVNSGGNVTNTSGASLLSDNQIMVTAANNVDNAGTISSQITRVAFGGSSLTVSGEMAGTNTLIVQSAKDNALSTGQITNSGKLTGTNIALQTNGNINQHGTINASGMLIANGNTFLNNGTIKADTLNITSAKMQNKKDIDANAITITASNQILNEGKLTAVNDMQLITGKEGNITNRNTITAGGILTMTTGRVYNGGYGCGLFNWFSCGTGTLNANQLILNSTHSFAQEMGGTQNFKSTVINTVL